MDFSIPQFIAAAGILLASSVLQGIVGFASGLFGIPLLLMSGFSLPQSVTIILLAATVQTMTGTYKLRDQVDYRGALRPVLIRLSALPAGVAALWLAGSMDKQQVRQVVGFVLLAVVAVQWCWKMKPVQRLHPTWEWLAFGGSGFLLGFCGMGGPPMVMWVMAHDWTATRSRAFLFFVLMTGMLPQALLLYFFFGHEVLLAALLALLGIPLVLLGTALGLTIGAELPKRNLRRLTYAVLTCVGLCAVLSPVVSSVTQARVSEQQPAESATAAALPR